MHQIATSPPTLDAALAEELETLERAGLRRTRRVVSDRRGGAITLDGRPALDFSSNDYLGLAADPRLAAAARAQLALDATGAAAARLIAGTHPLHVALEARIARFKRAEAALLFPSGYMANAGAIPALVGRRDAIYADQLNHASLIDGCRLSRAELRVFPHNDLDALDAMLAADAGKHRRRLLVVDGVFSMDGDLCPLDRLVEVARRHEAWTYVDDAHGTGVLGANGRGAAEHFGVEDAIDVRMGTLGKALGTSGAFVAGSPTLVELLLNRARAFIFTTATPPAIAAATIAALDIAEAEPWRRERLRANARRLRAALAAMGFEAPGEPDGHIVPVMIGDAAETARVGRALAERGVLVGAVRPPTVPMGTSRLRVSVSAVHTELQIDELVGAIRDVLHPVRDRHGSRSSGVGAPGTGDVEPPRAPAPEPRAQTPVPDRHGVPDAVPDWISSDTHHAWHPYTQHAIARPAVPIVRAEGARLYDVRGREIVDAISSWWVTLHGHGEPSVIDAVARQARALDQVIFAGFTHEPAARLAEELSRVLPGNPQRIFYSDDGSTAVEVALKIALQYWDNRGERRPLVAAMEHAYHGDTFGAMSVSASSVFTRPFDGHRFEVARLPFPDEGDTLAALDALLEARGHELAAVIVEPLVLGAGGMRFWGEDVLRGIRARTEARGVLLIADEVMTGFGRTGGTDGTRFACEKAGVAPDLTCLSKGLTGGVLPLGVTAATERLFEGFLSDDRARTLLHGHSFTGSPMACAAARASLALLLDPACDARRARIEATHRARLARVAGHPLVRRPRVLGTLAAFDLDAGDGYLAPIGRELGAWAMERGVLLRPLGNVAYLLPPYGITDDELSRTWDVIDGFLAGRGA